MQEPRLVRSIDRHTVGSKRPGISLCELGLRTEGSSQNVLLAHYTAGAEVAYHKVAVSEAIYIISGTYDIKLEDGQTRRLYQGDFIHFPSEYHHGMNCISAGTCLIIFF